MRTTVSINDELLIAAKQRARDRGITLGELLDAALQLELGRSIPTAEPPTIPVFRGGGATQPGVNLDSNRALAELLDEGIELDKRR